MAEFPTEREGWLPSASSASLVREKAAPLLDSFSHQDLFEQYYKDHENRIGFDLDYAKRFIPTGATVLEVGALPYFLTVPLIARGFHVVALDKITGEYIPKLPGKHGITGLHCDLDAEPIPAADSSFDAVIMNEVFEHLRINLIRSMREVFRVMRPGARLLLSTPNLRSIRGLYNLLVRHEAYAVMGGLWHNYSMLEERDVMGHVREYTAKEVTDFLDRLGFRIERVIYRGCYSGSFGWRLAHYATRLRPGLKPFFSVIARKP